MTAQTILTRELFPGLKHEAFLLLDHRPGTPEPTAAPRAWKLIKMMDQHAYLDIAHCRYIHVGDMIGFDISHPCLTFDKDRKSTRLNSSHT